MMHPRHRTMPTTMPMMAPVDSAVEQLQDPLAVVVERQQPLPAWHHAQNGPEAFVKACATSAARHAFSSYCPQLVMLVKG